MIIDLEKVRFEPVEWQEKLSISAKEFGREDLQELGEIDWRGEINYAPPDFLLQAKVAYQQALTCDRCLTPATLEVAADVEMVVVVGPETNVELETELSKSDLAVFRVEEERLDTYAVLMEQIQLNLPMRVVCDDGCRGLCPTCGANRNEGPCSCDDNSADPRWSALVDMRDRLTS